MLARMRRPPEPEAFEQVFAGRRVGFGRRVPPLADPVKRIGVGADIDQRTAARNPVGQDLVDSRIVRLHEFVAQHQQLVTVEIAGNADEVVQLDGPDGTPHLTRGIASP